MQTLRRKSRNRKNASWVPYEFLRIVSSICYMSVSRFLSATIVCTLASGPSVLVHPEIPFTLLAWGGGARKGRGVGVGRYQKLGNRGEVSLCGAQLCNVRKGLCGVGRWIQPRADLFDYDPSSLLRRRNGSCKELLPRRAGTSLLLPRKLYDRNDQI